MNIDHLAGNFEKRKVKNNIVYNLGEPATSDQLEKAEYNLKVNFPYQLKLFYSHYNGLFVKDPRFKIFSLDKLSKIGDLINFAVIKDDIKICFDCSQINKANQWDIINCNDGHIITHTFSSFWSNKIWAWIDKRREVWKEFDYQP
jgi:hypothetical protein